MRNVLCRTPERETRPHLFIVKTTLLTLRSSSRADSRYDDISPFYRCLQTATPLADRLDLPILIEHGLSEFYLSVQQGRHPRAKSASVLQQWFPRIDPLAHDSLVYPNQKGETILEVHSRAEVTLRKLITITEARDPHVRHVIIFTHAATNIAMGRALTADSTLSIRSGTCSVGKYKRNASVPNVRDGLGQWTQTLNGDTSFLKAGEEVNLSSLESVFVLCPSADVPRFVDTHQRHWEFSYIVRPFRTALLSTHALTRRMSHRRNMRISESCLTKAKKF